VGGLQARLDHRCGLHQHYSGEPPTIRTIAGPALNGCQRLAPATKVETM
jgi:hypothetical protein